MVIRLRRKFLCEEPLEEELWECKACGWVGDDPVLQEIKIFDDNVFVCPECGEIL